jgi:endo-1,4-beta-xylanase
MVRGNPFVEFFIVDTARGYDEGLPGYTLRGTVNSDGAIYDVYHVRQFTGGFAPAFIDRIWSIRRSTYAPGPVSGTITTSNHFDAWRSFGLPFGTIEQLVVAVEGYRSAGSAAITVKP